MVWIKCNACGYGIQVTREHGVGLGEYRCTVCGGRMIRAACRPLHRHQTRRCYREECLALVEDGMCGDGHAQPPY